MDEWQDPQCCEVPACWFALMDYPSACQMCCSLTPTCSCTQIFLTANPKLRSEVAKQFNKLRAAILRNPAEAKRLQELSNQDYPSLADIPSDAFPLFWTTKQYLRAVDATLPDTPVRDGPFFPRYAPGPQTALQGTVASTHGIIS